MGYRQYSDEDKASALAALDANGGNLNRTARDLKMSRSTLQEWVSGRVNPAVPEIRRRKKEEIAGRLTEVVHTLIDELPKKIGDAGLQTVVTSIAIAIDKIQLLEGKPTERNEIVNNDLLSDDERATRITEILDRARARRDGRADSSELVQ